MYETIPGKAAATSEDQRRIIAYDWLLSRLSSRGFNANPPLSNKEYWYRYLDYVVYPKVHAIGSPPTNPPKKPTKPTYNDSHCFSTECDPPPPIGNPSIGNPSIGNPSIGNPSIGNPSIGNPSIGNPSIGNPSIGNPSIGNPSIGNPSIGTPSIGTPSIGGGNPFGPNDSRFKPHANTPTWLAEASELEPLPSTGAPKSFFGDFATIGSATGQAAHAAAQATGACWQVEEPGCVDAERKRYDAAYKKWRDIDMPEWREDMDEFYEDVVRQIAAKKKYGAAPYSRGLIPRTQLTSDNRGQQMIDRMADTGDGTGTHYYLNNPNESLLANMIANNQLPNRSSVNPLQYMNQFGYRTYGQFQMDYGRDLKPDGRNHVPLSTFSPYNRKHSESVDDPDLPSETVQFPARSQPMHAARRSLIKALMVLKYFNQYVDMKSRDHVAIVNFDFFDPDSGRTPQILQTFNGDYDQVMKSVGNLQCVTDKGATTALEPGMRVAYNYMEQTSRDYADKVVVVFTDGNPNRIYTTSQSGAAYFAAFNAIDRYANGVADGNDREQFYANATQVGYPGRNNSTRYDHYLFNAALVQAHKMAEQEWHVYSVGLGYGVNADFIDRLAVLGKTEELEAENVVTGTPAQVEEGLTKVFKAIVLRPRVVLVD